MAFCRAGTLLIVLFEGLYLVWRNVDVGSYCNWGDDTHCKIWTRTDESGREVRELLSLCLWGRSLS